MNSDHSSLEADLRQLQAAALDPALLARLESAADGSLTRLSPEEIRFESHLRQILPLALTANFMARLESVVRDTPSTGADVIVPFPKAPVTRRSRPWWASAAAVALIGAASALLIPAGKSPEPLARRSSPVSQPVTRAAGGNLVPAAFDRGVSEVHDAGIVWQTDTQPKSVVRVIYKDKMTLKDDRGRTFQVEQPRVEYLLVPARTD